MYEMHLALHILYVTEYAPTGTAWNIDHAEQHAILQLRIIGRPAYPAIHDTLAHPVAAVSKHYLAPINF